ncbi:hypothetical protein PAU_02094 [Photorhabdus asymbiotica]|uniref:Uncharacterized protein n=1 Tax=Photorhabdus asymbiotica subsp. asymbiotica (strain ATCC 43949 / 3105-77) TaxID=553480 RepID=C7BJB8_PHOAA|nr:hypothetical protein PAU_02094 [Photorhabdus asymbiotica]
MKKLLELRLQRADLTTRMRTFLPGQKTKSVH